MSDILRLDILYAELYFECMDILLSLVLFAFINIIHFSCKVLFWLRSLLRFYLSIVQ